MKRNTVRGLLVVSAVAILLALTSIAAPAHRAYAQSDSDFRCAKHTFFGLKPWYYYFPLTVSGDTTKCTVDLSLVTNDQQPDVSQINKLWLIGIVVFEDLVRLSALLAVGFIMYGGVRYITSQGEPEHTKDAMSTILNAIIGLAIAVAAATIVAFIGKSLGA